MTTIVAQVRDAVVVITVDDEALSFFIFLFFLFSFFSLSFLLRCFVLPVCLSSSGFSMRAEK